MNDQWETPQDLFDALDSEFYFDTDGAANHDNTKVAWNWFDENEFDLLWTDNSVWLNPPYSRGNIDKFMEKAYTCASQCNCTVVCLVRCDPSTDWFQKWVYNKATEVRLMQRRVKFVGANSAYNFPTCIVVYRPGVYGASTDFYLWDWK